MRHRAQHHARRPAALGAIRARAVLCSVLGGLCLWLSAALAGVTAQALPEVHALPQQSQASPPQTESGPPAPPKHDTPAAKPRKVYTDDDLPNSDPQARATLADLNQCDWRCFGKVAQDSGADKNPDSKWKWDLLDKVRQVREDTQWQKLLLDLIQARTNACRIVAELDANFAKNNDPQKVTRESAVAEEEYWNKRYAALRLSDAASSRVTEYVNQFLKREKLKAYYMFYQRDRVIQAKCPFTGLADP